ncbi:podocalyxin-like [Seriola lalandi dorsalis]|nr:podocalyxin-like [Seriola lalandi dorsalis]
MATTATTATTAAISGNSVISSNSATVQTPEPFVPSKTPETHHTKTTKITKVSTDATAGQQPTTHTSVTTKMNEGDIEKTTVTVTRSGQTTLGALEPSRSAGTTSNPTIMTKRSSPVPENLTGTTSLKPTSPTTITGTQRKRLQYSLNSQHEEDHDKELVEVCKRFMVNVQDGNCTLIWSQQNDKVHIYSVEINGKMKNNLATQYYEEISKKKATDNKTLIAILASCGALLIMIVILAVCASHHRKPYHENQQHLTEELHTVENGYHDNPTLEVMEVQPEMQEKKMALIGEFNDSWIVPIDNLLKEDIPDEEDTHL